MMGPISERLERDRLQVPKSMSTVKYRERERDHIRAHNALYHASIMVSVVCMECGKLWKKRRDTFKNWNGCCAGCIQRQVKAQPGIRMAASQRARLQVLRQGGIPNARKFDGVNHAGSNHHRWKGGITPEMQRQRGSKATADWRIAVYLRDEFTCVVCGQVGGKLHAHHIKSWAEFPELRFDVSNGVTACKKCHKEILHKGSFHRKPFVVQGVA